jgi:hypothetical protein
MAQVAAAVALSRLQKLSLSGDRLNGPSDMIHRRRTGQNQAVGCSGTRIEATTLRYYVRDAFSDEDLFGRM